LVDLCLRRLSICAAPQQSLKGRLARSNRGMFKRILIATRGEIACRVIKAAWGLRPLRSIPRLTGTHSTSRLRMKPW
jgi:hypothetical protein